MPDSEPRTVTLSSGDDGTAETAAEPSWARPRELLQPSSSEYSGRMGSSASYASRRDGFGKDWSEPVAEALHNEEVERAKGWSISVMLLCVAGLMFLSVLPGETWNKALCSLAMAALAATAGWVRWRCIDKAGYTPRVFRIFGWVAATVSFELEYFLGVFSPTPLVVTLGLTFFGMGMDRKHALAIPIYAIAGYMVLSGLTAAGVLADRGLISAADAPILGKVFFVAMAPFVLLLTLWMARISRRAMADAMANAAAASRLAAEREALLAEVQQDLEDLRQAGAGRRGRFSGNRAGDYELQELVGRGAMGEVYAATRDGTEERAAIKLLRPDALVKGKMLERFLREGEAASSLQSPNVVTIYAVGELEGIGIPYIAMELLEGEDLAALLRKQQRMEPEAVVAMLHDIARGLDSAHSAGIIHRDLKPQNLFQHHDADDRTIWKILDFGVSKLVDSRGTLTQQAVIGTPGYMSPEQARGADVKQPSDVFSLGAVAYRALTGRPPFSGVDLPQKLYAIVYQQPQRPSALVDHLPHDVDRVLAIALAKDPEKRFASAAEVAAAMAKAVSGKLDSTTRTRANELISEHPWGQRVE